jgi:uncharacterized protein
MNTANSGVERKPNRLAREKSPYLLQHAENPVDWHPWGEEAFSRANAEEKPIFLSIGYATCHWCHVMAHESFEDEGVARLLNQSFVSIKVDREERPDVDQVYMAVCQALTGSGGWPLSIFMTPGGKPFFAGTYFPKTRRGGMSGFVELLSQIASLWQRDRARILQAGEQVTQAIQPKSEPGRGGDVPDQGVLRAAYSALARSYDPKWGGFGAAPKFPSPHQLTFLLRWHIRGGQSMALEMVEGTLKSMRRGGIFDHIGFGFHRYSVDERWLVPHFEKMLYDQALLSLSYTEAYQVTGKEAYAGVTREILRYVLRDMRSPEGAFYSAEDADSEGQEGLFYVWRPEEVKKHLGEDTGDLFCRFYGITETGNFEGDHSIPHVPLDAKAFAERRGMEVRELEEQLAGARARLFQIREQRVHPLKDDKVLTSWNGLMIAALSRASQALGDPAYAEAARGAAQFILDRMRTPKGRLLRRYREGEVAYPAYLDDYAFLVWGLLELYETTFDMGHLEEALRLNRIMLELFWDGPNGGLFFTGPENERLIARSKEAHDGALPSGNSVAALNLLRLGRMTGDSELEEKAERIASAFGRQVSAVPMAHTHFLMALDFMLGPSQEIVVSGHPSQEATRSLIEVIHRSFLPNKVLLLRHEGQKAARLGQVAPFVSAMAPGNGNPTAYVCVSHACKKPVTDPAELRAALGLSVVSPEISP